MSVLERDGGIAFYNVLQTIYSPDFGLKHSRSTINYYLNYNSSK